MEGAITRRSAHYMNKTTAFDTPIFAVQGFTDMIFPAWQALSMFNRLHIEREDEDGTFYPMHAYLGDYGHAPSQNKQPEREFVNDLANKWIDYYLRGVGKAPDRGVSARLTTCGPEAPIGPRYFDAHWEENFIPGAQKEIDMDGTLVAGADDPHKDALDPRRSTNASSCRTTDTAVASGNLATTLPPLKKAQRVLGFPEVGFTADPTHTEMYVAAHLWHVNQAGTEQTLIDRGVVRLTTDGPQEVSFELFGNGYRMPKGHQFKLELTANDVPSFRPFPEPTAEILISDVKLQIPKANPETLVP
jgi:predicted acyl esterase